MLTTGKMVLDCSIKLSNKSIAFFCGIAFKFEFLNTLSIIRINSTASTTSSRDNVVEHVGQVINNVFGSL